MNEIELSTMPGLLQKHVPQGLYGRRQKKSSTKLTGSMPEESSWDANTAAARC